MEQQPDGSVIIELQPAIEHEVIRWVLGEAGRIEVLAPLVLREKIAAAGAEIARTIRDFHIYQESCFRFM